MDSCEQALARPPGEQAEQRESPWAAGSTAETRATFHYVFKTLQGLGQSMGKELTSVANVEFSAACDRGGVELQI